MPLDPALPPSLKATLDDLKRRLANLERSPRLTSASIRNGLLRVLDAAGRAVVLLGQTKDANGNDVTVFEAVRHDGVTPALWLGRTADGTQFFSIVDKASRIVVSDDALTGGLATPWIPVSFAPLDAIKESGFVYLEAAEASPKNVYFLRFLQQHPRLALEGQLWADAGTAVALELLDEGGAVVWGQSVNGTQTEFAPTIDGAALKSTSKLQTWRGMNLRLRRTGGSGRCGARLNAAVGVQS